MTAANWLTYIQLTPTRHIRICDCVTRLSSFSSNIVHRVRSVHVDPHLAIACAKRVFHSRTIWH